LDLPYDDFVTVAANAQTFCPFDEMDAPGHRWGPWTLIEGLASEKWSKDVYNVAIRWLSPSAGQWT
jgi:hypothetical protein